MRSAAASIASRVSRSIRSTARAKSERSIQIDPVADRSSKASIRSIKADSPRLAIGTLVGANAVACCMLLARRDQR